MEIIYTGHAGVKVHQSRKAFKGREELAIFICGHPPIDGILKVIEKFNGFRGIIESFRHILVMMRGALSRVRKLRFDPEQSFAIPTRSDGRNQYTRSHITKVTNLKNSLLMPSIRPAKA